MTERVERKKGWEGRRQRDVIGQVQAIDSKVLLRHCLRRDDRTVDFVKYFSYHAHQSINHHTNTRTRETETERERERERQLTVPGVQVTPASS